MGMSQKRVCHYERSEVISVFELENERLLRRKLLAMTPISTFGTAARRLCFLTLYSISFFPAFLFKAIKKQKIKE
jgi:hypothetical protein